MKINNKEYCCEIFGWIFENMCIGADPDVLFYDKEENRYLLSSDPEDVGVWISYCPFCGTGLKEFYKTN